jgi:hypothetical protein
MDWISKILESITGPYFFITFSKQDLLENESDKRKAIILKEVKDHFLDGLGRFYQKKYCAMVCVAHPLLSQDYIRNSSKVLWSSHGFSIVIIHVFTSHESPR